MAKLRNLRDERNLRNKRTLELGSLESLKYSSTQVPTLLAQPNSHPRG